MTAKVTLEDVKRVAELAHLELTPEETRNMEHDLNAILDHVAHSMNWTRVRWLRWPR